jgi:hypothetical protein
VQPFHQQKFRITEKDIKDSIEKLGATLGRFQDVRVRTLFENVFHLSGKRRRA